MRIVRDVHDPAWLAKASLRHAASPNPNNTTRATCAFAFSADVDFGLMARTKLAAGSSV